MARLNLDKTPYILYSLQSSVAPLYNAASRFLNQQSAFEVQSRRDSRLLDDFHAFERATRLEHFASLKRRSMYDSRLIDRLSRLTRTDVSCKPSKLISNALGYPALSLEEANIVRASKKSARDALWSSNLGLRGTDYRITLRKQATAEMANKKETRFRTALVGQHAPILRRLQRGSRFDHPLTVPDAPTATWPPHPALEEGLGSPDSGSPIDDASKPITKKAPAACRSGSLILSGSDLSDWLDRHFGDSLLMASTGTTGPDTRMAPPIAGAALTF